MSPYKDRGRSRILVEDILSSDGISLAMVRKQDPAFAASHFYQENRLRQQISACEAKQSNTSINTTTTPIGSFRACQLLDTALEKITHCAYRTETDTRWRTRRNQRTSRKPSPSSTSAALGACNCTIWVTCYEHVGRILHWRRSKSSRVVWAETVSITPSTTTNALQRPRKNRVDHTKDRFSAYQTQNTEHRRRHMLTTRHKQSTSQPSPPS